MKKSKFEKRLEHLIELNANKVILKRILEPEEISDENKEARKILFENNDRQILEGKKEIKKFLKNKHFMLSSEIIKEVYQTQIYYTKEEVEEDKLISAICHYCAYFDKQGECAVYSTNTGLNCRFFDEKESRKMQIYKSNLEKRMLALNLLSNELETDYFYLHYFDGTE